MHAHSNKIEIKNEEYRKGSTLKAGASYICLKKRVCNVWISSPLTNEQTKWVCYFKMYALYLKSSGSWSLRIYKTAHRSDCCWRDSCLHFVMNFKLDAVQAEN